jgi:hypothetical protein
LELGGVELEAGWEGSGGVLLLEIGPRGLGGGGGGPPAPHGELLWGDTKLHEGGGPAPAQTVPGMGAVGELAELVVER